MRLRLSDQLSLLLLLAVLAAVSVMSAVVSWNLREGFLDYLEARDAERLDRFAAVTQAAWAHDTASKAPANLRDLLDELAVAEGLPRATPEPTTATPAAVSSPVAVGQSPPAEYRPRRRRPPPEGGEAVRRIERTPPAAVLLDLMLPGLDGLEVCRVVRKHSDVPIIMITARVEEVDRLLGLEVGADDYVCKPFSPRELMARLRALIRRSEGRVAGNLPTQGMVVDEAAQRIRFNQQVLPLTPIEFRLFRALLAQPGRALSRARLLDSLHDDFREVSERAIDSHIKNLRRKIEAAGGDAAAIASVYGMGYRFDLSGG